MATQTAEQGLTKTQVRAFEKNGFHIARGLFTKRDIKQITRVFMDTNKDGPVPGLSEINKSYATYSPEDPLSFYPRMMHPHNHPELPVGPVAMRYMLDPRVRPILRDLFGEEAVAAQSMFYFKPPGARGQSFHQDNYYLRVKPGTCMAAWVAIDDADSENGGMMVVPGSHKMDIACPEKADSKISFTGDLVPVPQGMTPMQTNLKAGDVLFFNGSLIHGSDPNTSKTCFRRAFICHYLPVNSAELSEWYKNTITFDGKPVEIAHATGGGPCGSAPVIESLH